MMSTEKRIYISDSALFQAIHTSFKSKYHISYNTKAQIINLALKITLGTYFQVPKVLKNF